MTEFVIERLTVVSPFATVALMVWLRFKRPMPGIVEDALERNKGLAELGHVLPIGTQFDIRVDMEAAQADAGAQEVIRLW